MGKWNFENLSVTAARTAKRTELWVLRASVSVPTESHFLFYSHQIITAQWHCFRSHSLWKSVDVRFVENLQWGFVSTCRELEV